MILFQEVIEGWNGCRTVIQRKKKKKQLQNVIFSSFFYDTVLLASPSSNIFQDPDSLEFAATEYLELKNKKLFLIYYLVTFSSLAASF